MEQELGAVLLTCLTDSEQRTETDAMRQAADIMTRFEDALTTSPEQQRHLVNLCATIGVSKRTLAHYCSIFLGVGPTEYMQLRRLRLVRGAILRADRATARIGELARLAGFANPTHFAKLYRLTFGETPSATLRQALGV